jgi:hypothetical protein
MRLCPKFAIIQIASFCFALACLRQLPLSAAEPSGSSNQILCRIQGQTLSQLDLEKKMSFFFAENFPHLIDNDEARREFYITQWRPVLKEMLDQKLMLADAKDRGISVSSGEVNEELQRRFGPNVPQTLDKLDMRYEDATRWTEDSLLGQRMFWWFVQSKAISEVTPKEIRSAYRSFLKEHPAYTLLTYQVISFEGDDAEKHAHAFLDKAQSRVMCPEKMLAKWGDELALKAHISKPYETRSLDLSSNLHGLLLALDPGEYSPLFHTDARKDKTASPPRTKLLYLIQKQEHPSPSFEETATSLKEALVQKEVARLANIYFTSLREKYTLDPEEVVRGLSLYDTIR